MYAIRSYYEQYETVCPYCGVGCTVVTQVRDDVIKRVIRITSYNVCYTKLLRAFVEMVIFIVILFVGYIYAWRKEAFVWD